MRLWLFHPVAFYPLALALAALVVGLSLQPQAWPRPPAPAAVALRDGELVIERAGFDAPASGPEAYVTVVRDFWGHARALRVAQTAGAPAPSDPALGAELLLAAGEAGRLEGRPAHVVIEYAPSAINAASGLAVGLKGAGPTQWIAHDLPPQSGSVSFALPAQTGVTALGLRALSAETDQAYALEIRRIRIAPQSPAAAP